VEDTKDRETLFEAFLEMEDPESVEQSIEDVLLSTWSSFPSLSASDDEATLATTTGTRNPVPSFDDGSSYATRSRRNTSNLFFPLGEKQYAYSPTKASPTKELSQDTMTTASTWMVSILNTVNLVSNVDLLDYYQHRLSPIRRT
jgi:hypothetical protein